jgi:hypothetical protein
MPSTNPELHAIASTNLNPQLVRPFDEWAVTRAQSLPLSALKGAIVGIDASHYINQHLINQSTREALLGALGGFPFALRTNIEKELQTFKSLSVACIFVFNGLDFGKKEQRPQPTSPRSFEQAWDLYDQQQADQVVDAFSSAGMISYYSSFFPIGSPSFSPIHWTRPSIPTTADPKQPPGTPPPETLFKFLQRILTQNGVEFMVAPYSAAAQVSSHCVMAGNVI